MTRIHCNMCSLSTNHDVLYNKTFEEFDEESGLAWANEYELLQCRGCAHTSLRHTCTDDQNQVEVVIYPPQVARRKPPWLTKLPSDLRGVLDETYQALHHDSRRLAVMGARTLVDMVMLRTVGDRGDFATKLHALYVDGYIGSRGRDILNTALDAGSAAAHRGYRPDAEALKAVMDIVESLLESVFHLEGVARRLKKDIPPRPPRVRVKKASRPQATKQGHRAPERE